ncbi:MAG TPA: amino acid permease [Verrucomicrobiae bacterium]|nr:amino acid permease [Verrucomicrobiae bacterium]
MSSPRVAEPADNQLVQGLGLLDSTMIVAGSMIGSGIFIVSADIARQTGSAGWLLVVWLITGLLTLVGALSYGELASMMPRAGGQYVYLRETYGSLLGFLYGWTLFLVIQTGTIAAVAVAFARFLGVLVPAVSPTAWIIQPIHLSARYALSLSTQQAVAISVIVLLSALNTRGLALGKIIQNTFTSAKTLSLAILIGVGFFIGRNPSVLKANFSHPWSPAGVATITPDLGFLPAVSATTALGLFVVICVAQVGSLFSSVAWETVTFTAGEVKNPRRNVPLSLILGTSLVIGLYFLVNLAYLFLLPVGSIQHAPDDRVATAAMQTVFHNTGALIMAAAILVSTFGCNNGLILTGARVFYAMARDGLFFKRAGKLNAFHVPAAGLALQCLWACLLVLPRTRLQDDPVTHLERYGNLYSDLLDYVVSATLLFYVLTIAGLFILRRRQPQAERPYRAWGYPVLPALYILGAGTIMMVLFLYKTQTTWPGLLIVLAGVPAYFWWNRQKH